MSNYVYNQSLGCFYHKSLIFQPENSVVIRKERTVTRETTKGFQHDRLLKQLLFAPLSQ